MNDDRLIAGRQLIKDLAAFIRSLTDDEIGCLFDTETRDELLNAFLEARTAPFYSSVTEYFFTNKHRATLLSAIRFLITHRYSFYGEQDGQSGYCSPSWFQWFDDGVLLLSGTERFEGYLCLFQNGTMKYAISTREAKAGETLGKDDFEFLSIEDFRKLHGSIPPEQLSNLDQPIRELQCLLDKQCNVEADYQKLLAKYPWILGFQYEEIQRHRPLDDASIPDFTGIKAHDRTRDIIEIKPPFAKLFLANGDYSSDFLRHWTQAERYLSFVREEKSYLKNKGMVFENPRCFLIAGFNLSSEQRQSLRMKEKLVPQITILDYNELLSYMKNTVSIVKRLRAGE